MDRCESEGEEGLLGSEKSVVSRLGEGGLDGGEECEDVAAEWVEWVYGVGSYGRSDWLALVLRMG